eukprot:TRINITY_DN1320_c1_g1_i1.p1 TRINITY_DN1320_c1_g1~~TRINITY_DN1320_c1_g1_i1.p1  ORF type:complete len:211 (+),score=107.10 TRINITY_DN1320_c1_g1_i1:59-691(+)
MEIETKFMLDNAASFAQAVDLFNAADKPAVILENYFFDAPRDELRNAGKLCRLRIKGAESAELTVKAHTEVEDGSVCRFVDQTVKLSVADARAAIQNPTSLLGHLPGLVKEFQFSQLKYLGGFKTSRKTSSVNCCEQQLSVKLDEVSFPFGAVYEVEIACRDALVHDVNEEVGRVLSAKGVTFKMGTSNKFQQFMAGCREAMIAPTSFAP